MACDPDKVHLSSSRLLVCTLTHTFLSTVAAVTDPSFKADPALPDFVTAMCVLDDGRVLVGTAGLDGPGLLHRLNADGALDPDFSPDGGLGGFVYPPSNPISLVELPAGRSLGVWYYPPMERPDEGRSIFFLADSSGFRTSVRWDKGTSRLATDAGDGIIVGNTSIYVGNTLGATPSSRVYRLTRDGTLDERFSVPALVGDYLSGGLWWYGSGITCISTDPRGRVLVAGLFGRTGGLDEVPVHLLRFNPDDPQDTTIVSLPGIGVARPTAMASLSDGRVAMVVESSDLVMLSPSLLPDPDFHLPAFTPRGHIHAICADAEGHLFLARGFYRVGGVRCPGLAALYPDGWLLQAFKPASGFDFYSSFFQRGEVTGMEVLSNGRLMIAGAFRGFDGSSANGVVRVLTQSSMGPLPVVAFAESQINVPEDAGGVSVVLECSAPTDRPVAVTCTYRATEAKPGSDFLPPEGRIVIEPGEDSRTVVIPLVRDSAMEWDETFSIELTSTSPGARIGDPRRTEITIRDDDYEPDLVMIRRAADGIEIMWMQPDPGGLLAVRKEVTSPAGLTIVPTSTTGTSPWRYHVVVQNDSDHGFFRSMRFPSRKNGADP